MTSFLSKLFGSRPPKKASAPVREDPVIYSDYSIISAPEKADDGNWRLSGHIEKATENNTMVRSFVRVDTFPTREEAIDFTLRKGKQIIDQQGDRIFVSGAPTGRA